MNSDLEKLKPYPFQRLNRLLSEARPPEQLKPIALSLGEPKHAAPAFIGKTLVSHLEGLSRYPSMQGGPELRSAIAAWLARRFDIPRKAIDADRQVLSVNGTREALFAIAQAVVDRTRHPCVLIPNPFYPIYEGAALLAGAEPVYLNCMQENGFIPDVDAVSASSWERCQLLYLNTPGNPTGACLGEDYLMQALRLADRHDFVIASDECNSEIYFDERHPPPGLLGAAWRMGNTEFRRCLVSNGLSKRSSVPGMRSGFVAGDARIIGGFLSYRTYHGCTMSPPMQAASTAAWQDENHVIDNRRLYREKFERVLAILSPHLEAAQPQGGFFLWPKTPMDDERFARQLFERTNVTVLPGSYLSRESQGMNPGSNRVRMALVAPVEEGVEAAERIAEFLRSSV